MTYPIIQQPTLSTSTIVPEDKSLFVPFYNRQWEETANAVNNKDNIYFQIAITDTPADISNLPNYGAYVVCVSGTDSTLPTLTASLCKASAMAAGSIAVLGSQVGTALWAGNALTITSTATNFQIAHNRAGISGNFNIRIIGTQGAK